MMITQLNVINVFTDEFDQVKAEGNLKPQVTFPFRHHGHFQLPLVAALDEAWGDVDTNLHPRLL